MSTNNKISTVVSSQLPDFVRADHPNFVSFLEAYYEYLEQSNTELKFGKTIERSKNLTNYFDIDKINETQIQEFSDKLYSQFLHYIPKDTVSNKTTALKHIKDFYRAGGTEKAYNFLFKILFGQTATFYYPKTDILIASSGKWLIEKSIRIRTPKVNGVVDETVDSLNKFKNTLIKGNTSTATARVEKVVISFENGVKFNEFFLSKIEGEFQPDEEVFSINIEGDTLSGNLLSGYLENIGIVKGGTGYSEGTPLKFDGGSPESEASAIISSVSKGNISGVIVTNGGVGFRVGDYLLFSSATGSGANARVIAIDSSTGYPHPNTFNIYTDLVSTYQSTQIGNYANSSGIASGNAYTALGNTLNNFAFFTGPALGIEVLVGGQDYAGSLPTATIIPSPYITNLGIIGRIKINSGGTGYANGDIIKFTNVVGGYGFGANAIAIVNSTGSIFQVQLKPLYAAGGETYSKHHIGGYGFRADALPELSVLSSTGSNANLAVDLLLGSGDVLTSQTGDVGQILKVSIVNRGFGYDSPPTINLYGYGDGTANLIANISAAIITTPGRYIDDTGHVSSSNYIQDRDYYQNFSYVIKIQKSLEKYKKFVLDILHPAGTKMFGEFMYDSDPDVDGVVNSANAIVDTTTLVPYITNAYSFANSSSRIYLNKGLRFAKVSGNANTGLISFWLDPNGFPANDSIIFRISNTANEMYSPKFDVRYTSRGLNANSQNSVIKITARDESNTLLLAMSSNVTARIIPGSWNHVLASWDLANTQNCRIYVNNVYSTNVTTRTLGNIQYDAPYVVIGNEVSRDNNNYSGCLSEFIFDIQNRNISLNSERLKFFGANGDYAPSNYLLFANDIITTQNTDLSFVSQNLHSGFLGSSAAALAGIYWNSFTSRYDGRRYYISITNSTGGTIGQTPELPSGNAWTFRSSSGANNLFVSVHTGTGNIVSSYANNQIGGMTFSNTGNLYITITNGGALANGGTIAANAYYAGNIQFFNLLGSWNVAHMNGASRAAQSNTLFSLSNSVSSENDANNMWSAPFFANNGKTLYVTNEKRIYQFTLTESYNVSTISYTGNKYDLSTEFTGPIAIRITESRGRSSPANISGFSISSNGEYFIVMGHADDANVSITTDLSPGQLKAKFAYYRLRLPYQINTAILIDSTTPENNTWSNLKQSGVSTTSTQSLGYAVAGMYVREHSSNAYISNTTTLTTFVARQGSYTVFENRYMDFIVKANLSIINDIKFSNIAIYLKSVANNANINYGYGGNFTFANNIFTCNTTPTIFE